MSGLLNPDWQALLQDELRQPYFQSLLREVDRCYASSTVFPPRELLFNAFNLCPLHALKVVIIGQDPYHGAGQAHGLCFSVPGDLRQPPSLKNIFKELKEDIPGFAPPQSGNLEGWAKQGVLLLNAVLSVEEGKPGSHVAFGWERFTDSVIRIISGEKQHLAFLLWGNYARGKASLIDGEKHLVLEAAHPSPLARGAFFGCRHFSKTNTYLTEKGIKPVDWSLG